MKAIFAIVDYSLGDKLDSVFTKENIPFKIITHGYGSAESELLELLGFGENKKLVMISMVQDEHIPKLYRRLDRDMNLSKAGTGIAFSIPLKSISAAITKMCNFDTTEHPNCTHHIQVKEKEMNSEPQFELIITIVKRGYFNVVKEAARSSGARGGTLIHGLGIGGEGAAKLLGISIQPEKDIILIVVHSEDKQAIMKKIIEEAGILKESRGICFSLPVDSAFGMAEKIVNEEE
ncbi:MAG: P-II family nitrogen regulator [Eubacterium sp.]|nr:P-II family nitrogen regulator [Eubacterium sp.]